MISGVGTNNSIDLISKARRTTGEQPAEVAAPQDGFSASEVQPGTSHPAVVPARAAAAPVEASAKAAINVAGTLVPGPSAAALDAAPAPTVIDPNNPQSGIRCGSFLRPDPMFTDKTQMVVHTAHAPNNPSGVSEVTAGDFKLIELSQLVSGGNEVLIGFATPKVFTVVPKGPDADGKPQSGYQEFDSSAYFQHPSRVSSGDIVESGVFIRPRNLPADAADALRAAMSELAGDRFASTAHANAKLLTQAGFTSGGRSFGGKLLPFHLFERFIGRGLEYKGQPVKFDIVSTTPATLDEHFRKVIHKEISSPIDAIKGHSEPPDVSVPQPAGPVAVPAPAAPGGPTVKIRNSHPGLFASALRGLMGAHVMWEALPDTSRADVNKYLPDTLKDKFHDDKPLTRGEKLKKLLFAPPKVAFLRKCIARTFDDAGDFATTLLADMLRFAGAGEEIKPDKDGLIKYNIVICGPNSQRGNRVVIARLDVKGTKADDILSKHVMISGYDQDVRFAGECWAERYTRPDGTEATRLHINNNSGTYRPKPEMAEAAAEYLRQMFPGVEIVSHASGGEQAPKGKPDYIRDYPVPDAKVPALQNLDGQKITLTDKQGNSQKYAIHRFKTVEFDMEFLDTPNHQLLDNDGLLRARTRFKTPGEPAVKSIEVEAKMPSAGTEYQNRVKGGEFKTAEAWQEARGGVLGPKSTDAAVKLARTVADPSLPLETVAWKKTQRELYFVTPTFPPLIGRLNPSFLVSVDTNTVRDSANGTPKKTYTVLQPQIFTKLPWTRKITPQRVEKFENLSEQLAAQFGLTEATETPYAEVVGHLDAAK